jgi:hypothetical protein
VIGDRCDEKLLLVVLAFQAALIIVLTVLAARLGRWR